MLKRPDPGSLTFNQAQSRLQQGNAPKNKSAEEGLSNISRFDASSTTFSASPQPPSKGQWNIKPVLYCKTSQSHVSNAWFSSPRHDPEVQIALIAEYEDGLFLGGQFLHSTLTPKP